MLRSPLQGLKNKHVECSLQQLDSVLILASRSYDVDTLLALGVGCLLPSHGGASIQSRADSNSSDEIGIRPDIPVEAVHNRFALLAEALAVATELSSRPERTRISY